MTEKLPENLFTRFIAELERLAFYSELQDANIFRVKAFKNAADILQALGDNEFTLRLKENTLGELKGIGKGVLAYLDEVRSSGHIQELQKVYEKLPVTLWEMRKLPGLGPKKIKALFEMLAIQSLSELEYACVENRIAHIKGFGAKTQDKILKAIHFIRSQQNLFLGATALEDAQELIPKLLNMKGVEEVLICGPVRRACEVVTSLDLLVLSREESVLKKLTKEYPKAPQGTPVQFFHAPASDRSQVMYQLFWRTGSDAHLEQLKKRAEELGFVLSETGLMKKDSNAPVAIAGEEEIYAQLKVHFVPPELREGLDEIADVTRPSPFPTDLVDAGDVLGGFHNHTNASDGANSLEEMVKAAQSLGWKWIGISDHSTSAQYANGLNAKRLREQHEEIVKLRKKYSHLRILHGVESDILHDGSLDYSNDVLKQLDYVIASIHSGLSQPRDLITDRICKALAHPLTTIIGHPTGRLLLGRAGADLDWDRIVETALKHGKAIELNANPHRLDIDWRVMRKYSKVRVAISPDAHSTLGLEDLKFGVGIARKGALSRKRLVTPQSIRDGH